MRIRDLQGLGEKTEATLAEIGITSIEQLRSKGAVAVYAQLCATSKRPVSLNFLYALAGALENRSWLDVAQNDKTPLLLELEQLREFSEAT